MEDDNEEEQVVISAIGSSQCGLPGENIIPNIRIPPSRSSLPPRFGSSQCVPQEHVIHLEGDQQEQIRNPTLVGAPLLQKISSSTRSMYTTSFSL
jgi:hypothetical protein